MPHSVSTPVGAWVRHHQAFVHLKPTKYLGLRHFDDHASMGHDPAKMLDTPLSARHPRSADRASGEAG
jgi:hypothetical protein